MKKNWLLCLWMVGMLACTKAPQQETINRFSDPKMLAIAKLQDKRDGKSLKKLLNSKKDIHRYYASLAYASVRDSLAIPYLSIRIQTDRSARVRKAAAYALGQIRHTKASPALIEAIGIEYEPEVRAVMIEALGKIPEQKNLDLILSLKSRDTITDAAIMKGIFHLVRSEISSAEVTERAQQTFKGESERAKYYAAQILRRLKVQFIKDINDWDQWLNYYSKADTRTQMILASVFSQLNIDSFENVNRVRKDVLDLAIIEKNPVTKANLLRSLNELAPLEPGLLTNIDGLSKEIQPQVLAVIRELIKNPKNKELVRKWLANKAFPEPSIEYIALQGAGLDADNIWAEGNLAINTWLKNAFLKARDPYYQEAVLMAMTNDISNYDFLVEQMMDSTWRMATRSTAMHAINEMVKRMSCKCEHIKSGYSAYVLPYALRSGDVGMISYACQGIKLAESPDLSRSILDSLSTTFELPREMEAYLDVKKTLAKLKGEPFDAPKPAYNHPVDWDEVLAISDTTQVIVETTKGNIVLQCLVDEAPASVWNFLKLVEEGYYDGKYFHRMVPGFVIQGGCSRGDGWGAPEWSQRAEFSNFLEYEAGMVGLASVGPDTEGFQFFITHCPTPHLTGRYTIFAKVVEGMNVVNQLDVGDRIVKIAY